MAQTQLERAYTMAAFCYLRGEIPSDPRARKIIVAWQRDKLLRMRRRRRELEKSRTMMT